MSEPSYEERPWPRCPAAWGANFGKSSKCENAL